MRLRKALCLSAVPAVWAVSPLFAAPLTGVCNKRLMADYIRAGGGNAWYIDCDAEGELRAGGKIYQVFEYSTSGYGQVSLSVMEPGFAPEAANFAHVLDAELIGAGQTSHSASLSDYNAFALRISKSGDEAGGVKKTLFAVKLKGECQKKYNDKGEIISAALESCSGANRHLQITPKADE